MNLSKFYWFLALNWGKARAHMRGGSRLTKEVVSTGCVFSLATCYNSFPLGLLVKAAFWGGIAWPSRLQKLWRKNIKLCCRLNWIHLWVWWWVNDQRVETHSSNWLEQHYGIVHPEKHLWTEVVWDAKEGDVEEEDKLLKEVEVQGLSHGDQVPPELSNAVHLPVWTNPFWPVVHLWQKPIYKTSK